jgi:hypothetical protein
MAKQGIIKKKHVLLGGLVLLVGFVGIRLLDRLVGDSDNEDDPDDNAPLRLVMRQSERHYPPFFDGEMHGLAAEGEQDEDGRQQLIVVGVDQHECDAAMAHKASKFAIARADSTGMWHPAVAETSLHYGAASDATGDVYAVAMPIGAGALRIAPGIMQGDHFTPFKHARRLALTNHDGLLYDYPNVPVVHIAG